MIFIITEAKKAHNSSNHLISWWTRYVCAHFVPLTRYNPNKHSSMLIDMRQFSDSGFSELSAPKQPVEYHFDRHPRHFHGNSATKLKAFEHFSQWIPQNGCCDENLNLKNGISRKYPTSGSFKLNVWHNLHEPFPFMHFVMEIKSIRASGNCAHTERTLALSWNREKKLRGKTKKKTKLESSCSNATVEQSERRRRKKRKKINI